MTQSTQAVSFTYLLLYTKMWSQKKNPATKQSNLRNVHAFRADMKTDKDIN